jgi:hypothetical protein
MEEGVVIRSSTNGMAVASLVLGVLWIGGLGALLALIFSIRARKQIDWSNGTQGGRGMATAGLVLGIVGLIGAVLYWALVVVAMSHTGGAQSY